MSAENEHSEVGQLILWLESKKGSLNCPNNREGPHVWIEAEPKGETFGGIRHYHADSYVAVLRKAKAAEDALEAKKQEAQGWRMLTAAEGLFRPSGRHGVQLIFLINN